MDIENRLQQAVRSFWTARSRNLSKQRKSGRSDTGARGAVTAGNQMRSLESLVTGILCESGLQKLDVKTQSVLEIPGYYRAEKKWDLIVVSEGHLVLAMEFKSQVGPSFGNNFNNRSEEAIGSATCLWTAYREGRFGTGAQVPFLGYFFLLEDCPKVHLPVRNREPYFAVDPAFRGTTDEKSGRPRHSGVSYCTRYELLCRRLVRERLYTSACLLLSTNEIPPRLSQPAEDLTFQRFVASLRGHVATFLGGRRS